MVSSSIALISLVVVAAALFAAPCIAVDKSFDFYVLALMWPGAYCAQSGCCLPTHGETPADDFYVRGLWTYSATTQNAVTKCTNTSFYIHDLDGISQELYLYWSNIGCPNNDGKSNWRSAWKTYGVCSGLKEIDYFFNALQLKSKFNVLNALSSEGIYPNYDLYSVSDIKNAIRNETGATPLIQCSKGPFNKFQLYQVYICVDKDNRAIDCPFDPKFTCEDSILFHPFRKWMLAKKNSTKIEMTPFEELTVA